MTFLSLARGSFTDALVYNARSDRISVFRIQGERALYGHMNPSEYCSDGEDSLAGSDNEDCTMDDIGEQWQDLDDDGLFSSTSGRPAPDMLRDIARWYTELKEDFWMGEPDNEKWAFTHVKEPFIKNGWPGNDFDALGFKVDHARALNLANAKREAHQVAEDDAEPLRDFSPDPRDVDRAKAKIKEAETLEDEWLARWELENALQEHEEDQRDTRRTTKWHPPVCEAQHSLMWELEGARIRQLHDYQGRYYTLPDPQSAEGLEYAFQSALKKRKPHSTVSCKLQNLDMAAIVQTSGIPFAAYVAGRVEAENAFPDKTFTDVTGLPPLDVMRIEAEAWYLDDDKSSQLRSLHRFAQFLETVPEEARETRKTVEIEIRELGGALESLAQSFEENEEKRALLTGPSQ